MKKNLTLIFVFFNIILGNSQKNYLTQFDDLVKNENLPFHNGKFNFEIYNIDPSSPSNIYFYSEAKLGSFIYNSQIYQNLNLKYDVFNDQLIYFENSKMNNGGLILDKTKINCFYINNLFFQKKNNLGYCQVLEEKNNVKLLQKHYKIKKEKNSGKNVTYYFLNREKFYLEINNHLFSINKKKSLIKLFPDFEVEINKFYNKNEKLFSDNKAQFFIKLIQLIEDEN